MNTFRHLILSALCGWMSLETAWCGEPARQSLTGRATAITEKVREKKLPAARAIAQLRDLLQLPAGQASSDDDLPGLRCELLKAACVRSTAKELRELGELFSKFPAGEERFFESFYAYSSAAFRLEVEKLQREPRKLKLPAPQIPLPAKLAGAGKESQDAFMAWAAVLTPYRNLQAATAPLENVNLEPPKIEDALRKLLPSPQAGVWKEFIAFDAPDFVFNNNAQTHFVYKRAVLLSLLADGKLEEAVGVACTQMACGKFGIWNDEKPYGKVLADFLTALGLDWEMVYAGSVLPIVCEGPADLRLMVAELYECPEGWHLLGSMGTPRGVRLGLATIRDVKFACNVAFPFLNYAAGPAPQNGNVNPPVSMEMPDRRHALPTDVRAEVLEEMAKYLDGGNPPRPIFEAINHVPDWLCKDLREPLTKLLKHPNHRIASKARDVLMTARLADPATPITPVPPPLRLRLFLDGEPLARTAVKLSAENLDSQDLTTDGGGHLLVSVESLLDRSELGQVKIRTAPPDARESAPPVDPEKPPASPKDLPVPWVQYRFKIQPEQDSELDVSATTGELEVGLARAAGISADARVEVSLASTDGDENDAADNWIKGSGTPGTSIVFPRLQVGKYRMNISGKGLKYFEPLPVQVVKTGSLKLVKLQAGRDVTGKIVMLDGNARGLWGFGNLLRNGAPFDPAYSQGDGWMGLPLGRYQFKIISSAEALAKMKIDGEEVPEIAPESRYAAFEMEFELTEKSPPTVDIGSITLKREEPEALGVGR